MGDFRESAEAQRYKAAAKRAATALIAYEMAVLAAERGDEGSVGRLLLASEQNREAMSDMADAYIAVLISP